MKTLLIVVRVAVFYQDVNFPVVLHELRKLQLHPVPHSLTLPYIPTFSVGRKGP